MPTFKRDISNNVVSGWLNFYRLGWFEFYRYQSKVFIKIYFMYKNWTLNTVLQLPHLHFFKVHRWIKIPFALCKQHLLTFLKRLVHPIEVRRCVRHFFAYLGEPKEIKIPTFMVQSSKFIQVNPSKIRLATIYWLFLVSKTRANWVQRFWRFWSSIWA